MVIGIAGQPPIFHGGRSWLAGQRGLGRRAGEAFLDGGAFENGNLSALGYLIEMFCVAPRLNVQIDIVASGRRCNNLSILCVLSELLEGIEDFLGYEISLFDPAFQS